jgi:DNA-binding response OmpR family regulator
MLWVAAVRVMHIEVARRRLLFARDLLLSLADEVVTLDVGELDLASLSTGTSPDIVAIARNTWRQDDTELCRSLHAHNPALPILAISGPCEARRRAGALRAGADEFLSMPFEVDELVARAVALVRRASSRARQARAGPLAVDYGRRQVFVQGRAITLTLREYDLVATLVEHAGEVVARSALAGNGTSTAGELKALDVHMSRIRQKIGTLGRCIETVRGVGYKLRAS